MLQSLLIQVDEATDSNALSSTLVLGRPEGLAAYDAAYERASSTIGIAIATLDTRLAEATTRCGVGWVVVDREMPETDPIVNATDNS